MIIILPIKNKRKYRAGRHLYGDNHVPGVIRCSQAELQHGGETPECCNDFED